MKGPYQRLAELAEQRERAELLPAGAGRETILQDIGRAEWLAQRSTILHERRAAGGEGTLRGPGLLEAFSTLTGALRGLPGLGGVASHLGLGINLVREAAGGLNVEQRMAAAGLTGTAGSSGGALAGIVAAAGPAAAAIGALALQIGTIARVTDSASANLREFGRAMGMSGGTAGEVAGLTGRGMAAGDIASRGNALRQRAMSDPFVWALLGYQPDPRLPGSNQNNARLLLAAQAQLRALPAFSNEQLRRARLYGMEDELERINVSPGIRRFQDAMAAQNRQVNDPASMQAARDFAEGQRLVGEGFKNLNTELGKPWVKTFGHLFNDLGNSFSGAQRASDRLGDSLRKTFGKAAVDEFNRMGTELAQGLIRSLMGGLAGTGANFYELLRGLSPAQRGAAAGMAGTAAGGIFGGAVGFLLGTGPAGLNKMAQGAGMNFGMPATFDYGGAARGFVQGTGAVGSGLVGALDILGDLIRDLAGIKKGKPGNVDQKQLDELKKILGALQDGFSGNVGPRTMGAIPAHMKGWYFDQNAGAQVMKFGPVSL